MSDTGGWITAEAWCEKYQDNLNTVQKRVADGLWERGEIYSAPEGGAGFIHELRALRWMELRGKLVL